MPHVATIISGEQMQELAVQPHWPYDDVLPNTLLPDGHSRHINTILGTQLNQGCRSIVECLKNTKVEDLYLLSGIDIKYMSEETLFLLK